MENLSQPPSLDRQIGDRLKALRTERGWSLDELARRSDVSRATLSRLENAEVSATALVLGRIGAAFGLTASLLLRMVEDDYTPLIQRAEQPVWSDPVNGFHRRSVSPPARTLAGEVIECRLPPATRIDYARPPSDGLEHHIVLLDGSLDLIFPETSWHLRKGDCLRFKLASANSFVTGATQGAHYLVFIVP